MFSYLIALLAFLSAYNSFQFYLIRRRIRDNAKTPILPGAEPIVFDKPVSKVALLLHGFTSTPKEVKYLAEYLTRHDIAVHAPLLPGHGTSPEHLALIKYPEWIRFVQNQITELAQKYQNIYLIGNSFGGTLALLTAESSRSIKGVVTISTPIYFRSERFLKHILPIMHRIKLFQKKKYSSKEYEKLIKTRSKSYDTLPLRALSQVAKATALSKKEIGYLDTPLLVMHSEADTVAHIDSAQYIIENSRSKDKRLYTTKESGHGIIFDITSQDLYENVLRFIQEH